VGKKSYISTHRLKATKAGVGENEIPPVDS
jgi:hypothetical protein